MASEYECQRATTSALGVLKSIIVDKDWSQYDKDYKLRTDAVWEKQQLKDWFRLTNKVTKPVISRCSISTS